MNYIWYKALKKSSLTPNAMIFKIVWPILYLLMFASLVLIFSKQTQINKIPAYIAFFIQLFLNIFWSYSFFYLKNVILSFVVLIALLFFIFVTIIFFNKISQIASFLLLPYFIWSIFALYLNYMIVKLNF